MIYFGKRKVTRTQNINDSKQKEHHTPVFQGAWYLVCTGNLVFPQGPSGRHPLRRRW